MFDPNRRRNVAPILLADKEKGGEVRVSAVFERDPEFAIHNRITLLGTRTQELELLAFYSSSVVRFRSAESDSGHTSSSFAGEAYFTLFHTSASTDVSELAQLQILHFERVTIFDEVISRKPSAVLCFLQPPRGWPVPWLTHHWDGRITNWISPRDRRWIKPRGWRIRFRLVSVFQNERDEVRHYIDTRHWRPGLQIEVAPGNELTSADFREQADRLWSLARPILAFYFKQFVTLADRMDHDLRQITESYWPVRATNSSEDAERRREPGHYSIRELLSSSLGRLARSAIDGGALHAAIHAYVSAQHEVIESAITSHCEGIERVLVAYEDTRGLQRNVFTSPADVAAYKVMQKRFKRLAGDLGPLRRASPTSKRKRSAVKRHLGTAPTLSLQDRIERMAEAFEGHWHPHEKVLLQDLGQLIEIRNKIVHGRHVDKYSIDLLFAERHRAEALFEKLFLCLIGCPSKTASGEASRILEQYRRIAGPGGTPE